MVSQISSAELADVIPFPLHQGELQHRVVKSYYRRGNKKKGYVHLATRMQRRGELLHRITERVQRLGVKAGHKMHTINRSEYTPLPEFSPDQHYQMAKSVKYKIHIGDMVSTHPEEPALKVCNSIALLHRYLTSDAFVLLGIYSRT